jgi:putative tryptophan/tyrosine transport system substrate-binding protein
MGRPSRFRGLVRMKVDIIFAAERRLPTMVVQRHWVEAGGLMSYVPDRREMYRRVAAHVDKILKGANPGEIPVELPTK